MGIILNRIREFEDKPFMLNEANRNSYKETGICIQSWLKKFPEMGINKGDVVSIIGRFSQQFTILLLALLENDNIVVPLDDEAQNFVSKRHHVAEVSHCFRYTGEGEVSYENCHRVSSHPLIKKVRDDNQAGIILFTSGSTGESKAAIHDFEKLVSKYSKIDSRKPLNTMVFLKFDHIGGLSTMFSILMNGGCMISVDDRSPESICRLIEKEKVELLPTTPSFLNMLIISKAWEKYDLSSLKLITYGTEPMPDSTLNSMAKIFPNVKLKQTYGLTELGIFPTRSKSNESTFMAIREGDIQVRISDDFLFIKTESAMLGYLNADSPFDKDGWYNTGDKVIVKDGYTKIIGRDSEIINVGGEKVYPSEVESVLLEIPNVKNVVVKGKSNPILGQIVMAIFELKENEDFAKFRQRVSSFCKGRLEPYKIPRHMQISDVDLISHRLKKLRQQNVEQLSEA